MSGQVYICGGWFSPEQEKYLNILISECRVFGLKMYSPKDDLLYEPGKTDPKHVFLSNLDAISDSDFLLVSTVEKDMGTLWECGYAFAKDIPLVFYYPFKEKFNLMLSESARAVLRSMEELTHYLRWYSKTGNLPHTNYTGEIE